MREQLERGGTQKQFAHKIGISVRTLRKIENANAPITATALDALSREFGVHRRELVFALDAPQLVTDATSETTTKGISFGWDKDQLIPRFDEDIAQVTMDEADLLATQFGF